MLETGEKIGWDHGEAQVFQAHWQGRPVILKRHHKPRNYIREVYGYHVWKQNLPELLFTRSQHLELVLSQEAGECALNLPSNEELYRSSSVILRQMYDTAPLSAPFSDGRGDLVDQVNEYIPRAAGLLKTSQIVNTEAMTRELLNTALPCPVLYHGDLHGPKLALERHQAHGYRLGTCPPRRYWTLPNSTMRYSINSQRCAPLFRKATDVTGVTTNNTFCTLSGSSTR